VASSNLYGTVDGTTFEAFIATNLVPKLWKNACVVMDNAKFHQGEMVRELIEQAGASLIYLPPYSPEFSPIENFWSKVKAILKSMKNIKDASIFLSLTFFLMYFYGENITISAIA